MPQASAKTHKSKLFHSHLVRNLLRSHLMELPIKRDFKKLPRSDQVNFAAFKKQWLAKFNLNRTTLPKQKQAQQATTSEVGDFKGLDEVR